MAFSLFCGPKQAGAHSPHDTIDALALSPAYATDHTAFIAIADHLRKSTDGGYSWKELINGMDHKHLLGSLAVSPSFEIDKTIWVSSRGDGIYRSQDGGDTWAGYVRANHIADQGAVTWYLSPLSYFGFPVQIPCLWADKIFDFLSLLAGIPVQPNRQNSYEDKGIRGCNPTFSSTP